MHVLENSVHSIALLMCEKYFFSDPMTWDLSPKLKI